MNDKDNLCILNKRGFGKDYTFIFDFKEHFIKNF
jgi:hypothetical protein